jgi:hypothetical protein
VVVVEPVASSVWDARWAPAPFVDVPAVDFELPDELEERGGCFPPVDDGETVVVVEPDPVVLAPPPPDVVPGGSDAVDEPPETSAPPDGDVPAVDPVFGDSVCVVPDVESPDPVASATATGCVEAIAAPTPRATASAPTRPT